jgi:hypothetical protein
MITIDCDTQAGQTIAVVTGTMVTVTGTNMGLPEWFVGNVGSVPGYGAWAIECMDGQIVISNPRPTYTLSYPSGYVKVYQDECPQTINLRVGQWRINGIVYEEIYTINSDVTAEAV